MHGGAAPQVAAAARRRLVYAAADLPPIDVRATANQLRRARRRQPGWWAAADRHERRLWLPERITPHSLRRTFCSLLYALGEDPGVVMDEMGHTDPALALRVYRQSMRRDEDEKQQLRALIEGSELAVIGRRAPETTSETPERQAA